MIAWESQIGFGGNDWKYSDPPSFPSPLIILVDEFIGHGKRRVDCREAIGAPNRDPRNLNKETQPKVCALITFFFH